MLLLCIIIHDLPARFSFFAAAFVGRIPDTVSNFIVHCKELERNMTSESGYLERNAVQTVKIVYITSYIVQEERETNKRGNVLFLLLYQHPR
jgi:hypothetical protein